MSTYTKVAVAFMILPWLTVWPLFYLWFEQVPKLQWQWWSIPAVFLFAITVGLHLFVFLTGCNGVSNGEPKKNS